MPMMYGLNHDNNQSRAVAVDDNGVLVAVGNTPYGNYPERDWLTSTGTGTVDNSVLFTANNMQSYQHHVIHATAGSVDVEVSVSGGVFTDSATSPIAMEDMNATVHGTYIIVIAAGKVGILHGKFESVRVVQNGVTAATARMGSYS